MNYNDHAPPHFHVRCAEQKALIAIESLALLRGRLSPRVFGMVMEWAALRQAELLENWHFAPAGAFEQNCSLGVARC